MKLVENSPKSTAKLITFLEKKISNNEVDANVLAVMERKLQAIIDGHKTTAEYAQYYGDILELQALVNLQRDDERHRTGVTILRQAINRAGSIESLHSEFLKDYVTSHKDELKLLDLSKLDDKQRAYLRSYGIGEATDLRFFTRQPLVMALLSVASLGGYVACWFYRNWRAVREAGQADISPFWRTFFGIFWVWPLFKIIRSYATAAGSAKRLKAGLVASAYIVSGYVISFGALLLFSSIWYLLIPYIAQLVTLSFLLITQNVAYDSNAVRGYAGYSPWSRGEIIFAIIVVIYGLGGSYSFISDGVNTTVKPRGSFMEYMRMQSLYGQYEVCKANQSVSNECQDIKQRRDVLADKFGVKHD